MYKFQSFAGAAAASREAGHSVQRHDTRSMLRRFTRAWTAGDEVYHRGSAHSSKLLEYLLRRI